MTMATAETKPQATEFVNEPFIDFSRPENRKRMQEALTKVAGELGREYPMYIGGQKMITTEKKASTNPSHPSQVIGVFQSASVEQANQAVEAAAKAFGTWKRVPAEQRVQCLFRAAKILRERKYEMNALIVYEAGKTWPEADADTAETIDFLEFYGREMLRLAGPQKVVPMKGEKNYLVYIPLGVGVVIPPWNFPAAIMAGMAMASLVTGNTVVLKPAGDTMTVAAKFVEIAYEAGIPKEVGLRISELAGKAVPGQMWIKRTVLEMGGKDSIIVDEEADVEAAVEGVVQSAFGYQGQKCSACSRA